MAKIGNETRLVLKLAEARVDAGKKQRAMREGPVSPKLDELIATKYPELSSLHFFREGFDAALAYYHTVLLDVVAGLEER